MVTDIKEGCDRSEKVLICRSLFSALTVIYFRVYFMCADIIFLHLRNRCRPLAVEDLGNVEQVA